MDIVLCDTYRPVAALGTMELGVFIFFTLPLALCALRVRCDYRIASPIATPSPKARSKSGLKKRIPRKSFI